MGVSDSFTPYKTCVLRFNLLCDSQATVMIYFHGNPDVIGLISHQSEVMSRQMSRLEPIPFLPLCSLQQQQQLTIS